MIIIVDATVGNEYSTLLTRSLSKINSDICLVVPIDKNFSDIETLTIKKWIPSKQQNVNKVTKLYKYFLYLWRVFCFASFQRSPVIHFQFFRLEKIESLFLIILRLLRCKIIVTAHNVMPHEHKKPDYLSRKLVYKVSHAIIAHSNFIKNELQNKFPINAEKISVIPHGNFDYYLPEKALSIHQARVTLGLSAEDHVLLFFGYIRTYKGLDSLLEAFEYAARKDKRLKLVIAGMPHSTELLKKYRSIIKASDFADRIVTRLEFIPVEDIPNYLISANLIALPYINIYHSGLIHLAYSFAKPVIATKVGDFGEMVVDNRSGFLVDRNDSQKLAVTINTAFGDLEKLSSMGEYAKDLSNTLYSWENIAKSTLELYRGL